MGYIGNKTVHFRHPRQGLETAPVILDGLAREGYLPILAMLAIQLYSYIGYIGYIGYAGYVNYIGYVGCVGYVVVGDEVVEGMSYTLDR